MSFKKCKVVMLPTNEKAQLNNLCVGGINKEVFQLKTNNSLFNFNQFQDWNLQHLYITSDEEIKVGDWIYGNAFNDEIKQVLSKEDEIWFKNNKHCWNKIIATTDKSITTPGYNSFDEDDICNCYLPQPSQQFIEKYIEEYNKGNVITDVLVEYNEISIRECQTCGNITNDWKCNCKSISFNIISTSNELKVNPKGNTITIKKVKDSWNREEVIELISDWTRMKSGLNINLPDNFDNWIETNL